MLNRIHLENFKASRNVNIRLGLLTVLAGLNSSGKSTLLQAIGAIRQSYDLSGNSNGLSLAVQFVHFGQFRDILS
jgi:predicted ATPase